MSDWGASIFKLVKTSRKAATPKRYGRKRMPPYSVWAAKKTKGIAGAVRRRIKRPRRRLRRRKSIYA